MKISQVAKETLKKGGIVIIWCVNCSQSEKPFICSDSFLAHPFILSLSRVSRDFSVSQQTLQGARVAQLASA